MYRMHAPGLEPPSRVTTPDGVTFRRMGEFAGMIGGCDFLKCDCEGAEWSIRPEDLDGVRRIEMELHVPPIGGPVNRALLDYIGEHYDFTIDRTPGYDVLGVMGVLHAVQKGGDPRAPGRGSGPRKNPGIPEEYANAGDPGPAGMHK